MALDTYTNLKAAIADYLDRKDLSSQIDDFIDLAEARHKREIRIQGMLTRASLTVDSRYVSLPDGFLAPRAGSLRLLTSPLTIVEFVDGHEMNRRYQASTGKPAYFTVHATFEFDRAPDQSYSGEIIYYAALTALSSSNETNALFTLAPDAYLYAALSAAEPFLQNDPRLATWEALYTAARDGLNEMAQKTLHPGPLASRVAGATP